MSIIQIWDGTISVKMDETIKKLTLGQGQSLTLALQDIVIGSSCYMVNAMYGLRDIK